MFDTNFDVYLVDADSLVFYNRKRFVNTAAKKRRATKGTFWKICKDAYAYKASIIKMINIKR